MASDVIQAYDIAIIGSGVAGALLALKLAQAGWQVALLEAGSHWQREEALERYKNSSNRSLAAPFKQPDWLSIPASQDYFPQQGQAYQPSFLKGVGGTTWHWTGITPRFLPEDFKLQSHYGVGQDWPISYNDLEPYYVLAEYALGVAGDSVHDHGSPRSKAYPMAAIPMTYGDQLMAAQLAPMGLSVAALPAARNSRDYDGRPACKGNNMCTPLCPIGASYSADSDVAKAVAAGAHLITQAVVYQLDADKFQRISKAHYKNSQGISHFIRAKRFVLACNSIETPRLLLNSVNEYAMHGVANTSDQVGRNLMDHAIFVHKFQMPKPMYIGRGPQSVSTILTGRSGEFRKKYAAAKFFLGNDLNIHLEADHLLKQQENWIEPLSKLRQVAIHQAQLGAEIESLPSPENRLTLSKHRKDPLGIALPDIDYQLSDYSQQGLKHWQAYTQKLIKYMGGEQVQASVSLSSHHPSGTTRMGSSAKDSVVNKHCQCHDHDNLFIVGGSVFPSMGTANPTLTIAALSLRLADYLKKQ